MWRLFSHTSNGSRTAALVSTLMQAEEGRLVTTTPPALAPAPFRSVAWVTMTTKTMRRTTSVGIHSNHLAAVPAVPVVVVVVVVDPTTTTTMRANPQLPHLLPAQVDVAAAGRQEAGEEAEEQVPSEGAVLLLLLLLLQRRLQPSR